MKKNNLFSLIFACMAIVGFQSCNDDDSPSPVVNTIVKDVELDASAYDKWVYFSFTKGEVVGSSAVEEKRPGLDWDIAFHRWDVRLNCGTSGSGQGGAIKMNGNIAKTGWDAVSTAPENGYSVDSMIFVNKSMGGQEGPVQVEVSGGEVITGGAAGSWITFSMSAPGKYDLGITNQIFVVKTADGKYAKIWLKQYSSEKGTGHITMKYAYQPDGSTKLD